MALAHSFYAEQAAVVGDIDEARRRRPESARLLRRRPEDTVRRSRRVSTRLAKLAMLDGDLIDRRAPLPRRRPTGFARLDRPVMSSIMPRHGRRLRRARRRLPGRRQDAGAAVDRPTRSAGGLHRIAPARGSAGSLLHDGQLARAEDDVPARARRGRRVRQSTHGDLPRSAGIGARCTGSTVATTTPPMPRPKRCEITETEGSAGSATASTPTSRSSRPPPRAAPCSASSPSTRATAQPGRELLEDGRSAPRRVGRARRCPRSRPTTSNAARLALAAHRSRT